MPAYLSDRINTCLRRHSDRPSSITRTAKAAMSFGRSDCASAPFCSGGAFLKSRSSSSSMPCAMSSSSISEVIWPGWAPMAW